MEFILDYFLVLIFMLHRWTYIKDKIEFVIYFITGAILDICIKYVYPVWRASPYYAKQHNTVIQETQVVYMHLIACIKYLYSIYISNIIILYHLTTCPRDTWSRKLLFFYRTLKSPEPSKSVYYNNIITAHIIFKQRNWILYK